MASLSRHSPWMHRRRSAIFSSSTRAAWLPSGQTYVCLSCQLVHPFRAAADDLLDHRFQVNLPIADLSAFLGDVLQWSLSTSTTALQLKSMFHLYASLVNKHCDRASLSRAVSRPTISPNLRLLPYRTPKLPRAHRAVLLVGRGDEPAGGTPPTDAVYPGMGLGVSHLEPRLDSGRQH
jgi:hypothetical protein